MIAKLKMTISFLLFIVNVFAQQTEQDKLIETVKEFHQAMVNNNTASLDQQTDKALIFGHSNGWIQTKKKFISDLKTGVISFQKITENNITVSMHDNKANVAFNATIDAKINGNSVSNKRMVKEVWMKKNDRWVLMERQATKI